MDCTQFRVQTHVENSCQQQQNSRNNSLFVILTLVTCQNYFK
jgi:hypothetical protein